MLCVICTRPIQNFKEENKLCQSCATRIKIQGDSSAEAFDDIDNLENLQKKLLFDLNLDGDSDYEAELEYLMQVKRGSQLKQKNIKSSKSNDSINEHPLVDKFNECNEMAKFTPGKVLHEAESEISENELMSGFSAITKKKNEFTNIQDSYTSHPFTNESIQKIQKIPEQIGDNESLKPKPNRRVSMNNSTIFAIGSANKPTPNSIACRAVIAPSKKQGDPAPQFEKIHLCEFHSDLDNHNHKPLVYAYKNPFLCPVTKCKNIVPVSDFIKHFKLNHIKVPILPIDPGICTNLFWDAKLDQFGISKSLMLLLPTGKAKQFGYGQFKDCLPIVIMTTKVKFLELLTDIDCDRDDGHLYMIWLTAMCSSDVEKICYTITAWNEIDDNHNGVHVVNSEQVYSLREDQNPKMVYRSGKAMILTSEQIKKLTNGNEKMVKLQVVIH